MTDAVTTLMTGESTPTDAAPPSGSPPVSVEPSPTAGAQDQPPGEGATTETKAAERVAPEKYEFKAPEGAALDPDVMGEFEGVARELKLSQEEAQTVVDKLAPKLAERMAAQQAQALQQARQDWAQQAVADKEFGGDKLTENLAVAKKARDAFASPELLGLLNESGLGNHPEVIRLFYRAGKSISEDRFVSGRQPAPNAKSTAQVLYPNQQ